MKNFVEEFFTAKPQTLYKSAIEVTIKIKNGLSNNGNYILD